MDRGHTAPFEKRGPRAERAAHRDALATVEQGCEKYVRDRMRPELVKAARQASAMFKRERGR